MPIRRRIRTVDVTIPQIREEMLRIAGDLDDADEWKPRLLRWVSQLKRRPAVRKAAKRAAPLTDEKRDEVRWFAEYNPHASYHEIAEATGVNIGRVSECLAGKRGE